ncbi:MAG: winged helix-turn-helix domain-containing protein [Chloroflexota bacterium]
MHLQTIKGGYWTEFPDTYRHEQIVTMAQWIATGESGALIGGSGTGKSNLVGFLTTRPDLLAAALPNPNEPFILLHFDVNSLPALTLTYFYRGLLMAMQNAPTIHDGTKERINALTSAQTNWDDAFFVLSTLQAAHRLLIEDMGVKVVWLLDRFDEACQRLESQALGTLRSLRDQVKGKLCYIVATRHPIERLCNLAEIDEFYELIAANRCWIGPMVERDARWIVAQMGERLDRSFTEMETGALVSVTGGLPAFLKEACTALANGVVSSSATPNEMAESLALRPEFQRNCREIWTDLSEEEQVALVNVAHEDPAPEPSSEVITYLQSLGLLVSTGAGSQSKIFAPIFAAYVIAQNMMATPTAQAGIMLHPKTRSVIRGGITLEIELTAHEDRLLSYFLEHIDEVCTKDGLMNAIWPEEQIVEGIRDDRLAQLVKRLRDKIEPIPNNPQYVLTVRGRGYRFVQAQS